MHTTRAATPLQAAQEWADTQAAGGRSLDAFAEGVVIQDVLTGREWEFYTEASVSVKAVLVDPDDVSAGMCTADSWEGT